MAAVRSFVNNDIVEAAVVFATKCDALFHAFDNMRERATTAGANKKHTKKPYRRVMVNVNDKTKRNALRPQQMIIFAILVRLVLFEPCRERVFNT
jgi:hypothetical protein